MDFYTPSGSQGMNAIDRSKDIWIAMMDRAVSVDRHDGSCSFDGMTWTSMPPSGLRGMNTIDRSKDMWIAKTDRAVSN